MIPATIRMNLKNIMLNERNQAQKVTDCLILLIGNAPKSIETEGKLVVARGWEKARAPHFSTLAWKIPWTEEPGRLQSMGSLRVRHNWATSLSLFTFMHWRRKWQPTPGFLPGESQGWRSLVGRRLRVAQSRTRLKRFSSSSSRGWEPWLLHEYGTPSGVRRAVWK